MINSQYLIQGATPFAAPIPTEGAIPVEETVTTSICAAVEDYIKTNRWSPLSPNASMEIRVLLQQHLSLEDLGPVKNSQIAEVFVSLGYHVTRGGNVHRVSYSVLPPITAV